MPARVCPSCSAVLPPGVKRCPQDGAVPVDRAPTRSLSRAEDFAEATQLSSTPGMPGPFSGAPASPDDPLVGTTVGEYEVLRRIGEGGSGEVYEAVHPLIGKKVAIKCLKRDVASNREDVMRLLAEARAANAIGHRGIIDIFGFGTLPDGRQYFVMEYLRGKSLETLLEGGPFDLPLALQVMDEVLALLSAAHGAGVIHRDLKPSNIFLVEQPDGSAYVKLLDFGLAKRSAAFGTTRQTNIERFVGTPAYVAPEQAQGQAIGPRSDLYAFGCVAFELLTGEVPFDAPTPWLILKRQLTEPPRRPSVMRPDLPPEFDGLILSLLAKDAADRPASAEVVRAELKAIRRRLADYATNPALIMLKQVQARRAPPAPAGARPAGASSSSGFHDGPTAMARPPWSSPSSNLPGYISVRRHKAGLTAVGLAAVGAAALLWALVMDVPGRRATLEETPVVLAWPTLPEVPPLPVPPLAELVPPETVEVEVTVDPTPAELAERKAALARLQRRLATVRTEWRRARRRRPAVEVAEHDQLLKALEAEARNEEADPAALSRGVDAFVRLALKKGR